MVRKKIKKIKNKTNIATPPKSADVKVTTPPPTITITKTLGLCPVCKAQSIHISRYLTGDILLYSNETAHAYDVVQIDEVASPRLYYKDGVGHKGHRMVVTCICQQCNSTWSEDYDTSIPTDVYDVVDNSKINVGDNDHIDLLMGYDDPSISVRDDSDDDDIYYGGRTWGGVKKDKPPLPPYIADPTPLYYETSITKTIKAKNTSKGDKK